MCENCGCESGTATLYNLQTGQMSALDATEHVHADGTRHSHAHSHRHGEDHRHGHRTTVVPVEKSILAKNDALAARNRAWFDERNILAINLMSAPGAGKTALLERTIRDLRDTVPLFVLEGDQATANDAERIRAAGAPVVQINTGHGCHLDAEMVARGYAELEPTRGSTLLIENVGNLVCPALFDTGEHRKVAILSITEGDDKPAKYPHMFAVADLVLFNKIDLAPYVEFDVERAAAHARRLNPAVQLLSLSARAGTGLEAWYAWLATGRRTQI